ncbi:MAG: hypothetical protein ACK5JD_07055 [Mangrovibacterium sp.]
MKSTSETGHAKNLANFNELISVVKGYKTSYNPSNETIKLPAMQSLAGVAQNAIHDVNVAIPAHNIAVAARETAFEPLSKLATRILNAVKASGASKQIEENVTSLVKKLQGKRIGPKRTDEQKAEAEAEGKEVKEHSTSQMSYDSRAENFDKLIQLLTSIAEYTPNEPELTPESLLIYQAQLLATSGPVAAASTGLSNARLARNEVLYQPITGLVDVAANVKTYIKSLYGATSPQYKQVSKLTFVNGLR